MSKEYVDVLACPYCKKETLQECYDSQHERDSSYDSRSCLDCGASYLGMIGHYSQGPPSFIKPSLKFSWEDPQRSDRFPSSEGWRDGSDEIGFADLFDAAGNQLGPYIVAFNARTGHIWKKIADDDGSGQTKLRCSRHLAPLYWRPLAERTGISVRIADVEPTEHFSDVPVILEESPRKWVERMSPDKLASVFLFYDGYLDKKRCVAPVKHEAPTHWIDKYQHLRWMCRECLDVLIPSGEVEKAMRWLGFVQGVLFERGDFTINQMREHSRS